MFDINLLKNPGIQEKEKSKERNSSIYKKNNINKNKTIDEPEVIVEGNVSFKSILLLISICILGCSVYYYIKYISIYVFRHIIRYMRLCLNTIVDY